MYGSPFPNTVSFEVSQAIDSLTPVTDSTFQVLIYMYIHRIDLITAQCQIATRTPYLPIYHKTQSSKGGSKKKARKKALNRGCGLFPFFIVGFHLKANRFSAAVC